MAARQHLVRLTFQLAGEEYGGLQLLEILLTIEQMSNGTVHCVDDEDNQVIVDKSQLGMVQKADTAESIFIISRSITCQIQDREQSIKLLYIAMQAAVIEMQVQIKNLEAVLKSSMYGSKP